MSLNSIEHIVFLMLENRSFDHMLGYLSREDTPNALRVDGLHAAAQWATARANYEAAGTTPYPIRKLAGQRIDDPPHGWQRVEMQIETPPAFPGPKPMGGFVKSYVDGWLADNHRRPADAGAVMGYYDSGTVWAYDFLARNYCVCDNWFTPLPAGTQPNRLMGMGGHSKIKDNHTPIPKHDLVYDWLNRNGRIGWAVYMWGGYLPFFALMPNWWDDILASQIHVGKFRNFNRLRTDWAPGGKVPPVVFIEPAYSELRGDKANDDHAPTGVGGGQLLVADLYDVLTGNPERWSKTLLIITYDEHGGFFDHVAPLPIREDVDGHGFATTGPRVPALLVSPLVDAGTIFNEPVDHTAFLSLLAEKLTPGAPYSPEVGRRQASYGPYGRLSNALRAIPRPGAPPKLPRPLSVKLLTGMNFLFAGRNRLRRGRAEDGGQAPRSAGRSPMAGLAALYRQDSAAGPQGRRSYRRRLAAHFGCGHGTGQGRAGMAAPPFRLMMAA
jgi:phospholipase C